jgi:hypothetical protein
MNVKTPKKTDITTHLQKWLLTLHKYVKEYQQLELTFVDSSNVKLCIDILENSSTAASNEANIDILYDLEISLLGIHLKNMECKPT